MILSIFHTGGLTLVLTIIWLGLGGWFGYQAYQAHNSDYGYFDRNNMWVKLGDKTPWFKIPQTWFAVVITVAYVIALLFIASDYKGV